MQMKPEKIIMWGVILAIFSIVLAIIISLISLKETPPYSIDSIGDTGSFVLDTGNDNSALIVAVIAGAIAVITGSIAAILIASAIRRQWSEEESREIESYSQKLKENIVSEVNIEMSEKGGGGKDDSIPIIDALGRMRINLEDIKEFYTWSQKQARAAFSLAIAMCIGGYILLVGAVLFPILFGLSMEMSIIPAIGGAIAEFIAVTALFVYRSSLSQLNHYHKALHEDERFLSSVNLLDKFNSSETSDEMLKEIIRSEIQMNLAEVKSDDRQTKDIEDRPEKLPPSPDA